MKHYIAADKNGDVFLFNSLPVRRKNIDTHEYEFWSGNTDEEKIFDGRGFYAIFGRLINIPEELILNISWEDEPIEININITKA